MPHLLTRGSAAVLLAISALSACGGARPAGSVTVGADSAPVPSAADVHFMIGMIAHHSQALVMSAWAPTHGASATVRTLAERIAAGQRDEIGLMQSWLRDRGHTAPEVGTGAVTMTMNGMKHEMTMPGMLTEAQLRQLDAARGAEFDRLFLTFMIQHHRGAVSMVKELFETDGAAQEQSVFKLASDVSADQTTEISRMQRMLVALTIR